MKDPKLWCRDLERHCHGDFSFAMVQANEEIEDYAEIHTAEGATFVGCYDGHGGFLASRYVSENLFPHILNFARSDQTITEEMISLAFTRTETGFQNLVECSFHAANQVVAAQGSCCLVGIIREDRLFIANLGDSRAVLGTMQNNTIVAEQLTVDHNVNCPEIRTELRKAHPFIPNLIVDVDGVSLVKGKIQVTRAIGDAYLKYPAYAVTDHTSKFHLDHPINNQVLRADPEVSVRTITREDQFVIFATHPFWDLMDNTDAVKIVHGSKNRTGTARKLAQEAVRRAALYSGTSYKALKAMELGENGRKRHHDDITVVVLFFDHPQYCKGVPGPLSVRGFDKGPMPLNFRFHRTL